MQESSVTMMIKIFGDYDETLSDSQEYLTIMFSPGSVPLQQRWRNNALSADFIADYFATFFSQDAIPALAPAPTTPTFFYKAELQDQVNFIANELLENAMKFCDRTRDMPITITLRLYPDSIVFQASNSLSPETVEPFQAFIQELLAEDPSVLLLRQLERNAADHHSSDSRLGILTLMSDYQTKVGWKFESLPQAQDSYRVTIMVYLKI